MSHPPSKRQVVSPPPRVGMVLLAALVCSAGASARSAGQTLKMTPCHLDRLADWAQCGALDVPEDPSDPDGRRITLRIAVLPADAQPARPDPVFMLAGGPGQSAVAIAAPVAGTLGVVNRHRDVVLVDQRGSGGSGPLDCAFDFHGQAFDREAKAAAVGDCLAGLDADPSHYGTIAYVRDLEAVREALGFERINLYGGSYGTRVAQVYIREFPESLRTVVLDGVADMEMRIGLEMGADAQLALDALVDRCRRDEACGRRFPDLGRQLDDLLADLEANPRDLQLADPATGEPAAVRMDHRLFALGLRALLYSPETQRLVPLQIEAAAQGDFAGLVGLTSSFNDGLMEVMTPGLLLAVLCSEDLADVDAAAIPVRERQSFLGTTQVEEYLGYCAAWPKPPRPLDRTPAHEDRIPVLLLSGALDPVTPPYRAEAVAARLGNSRHLVVDAGGHTVGRMGCVPDLLAELIESRDPQGLDASCLDDIARPSFFVSALGPTS